MCFAIKKFNDIETLLLYKILKLRCAVFVVEQNCAYQDIDDKDLEALHCYKIIDDMLIAYCRILPPGLVYNEASIGRVLVSEVHRGHANARQMMQHVIDYILEKWHETSIRISAQVYLQAFYCSLGFQVIGEVYDEDDIPHIEMLYTI